MTNQIFTKEDVAEVLQVAIGFDKKDFQKFIDEAWKFDFKKLVSEQFYYQILKCKDKPGFQVLIFGGDYDYQEEVYQTDGLKHIISYYAYARFMVDANISSTSFGFTQKRNPNSDPISLDDRLKLSNRYKVNAGEIFDNDVKKYIERNSEKFPKYKSCITCGKKNIQSKFNTRVIK